MSDQPSLFAEKKLAGPSWTHCGVRALQGEPEDLGGCLNTNIFCAKCQKLIGINSARKDLLKEKTHTRGHTTGSP